MVETAMTLNEADWQMSLEQLNESQPSKGIHRESRMQRMLTLSKARDPRGCSSLRQQPLSILGLHATDATRYTFLVLLPQPDYP